MSATVLFAEVVFWIATVLACACLPLLFYGLHQIDKHFAPKDRK